MPAFQPSLNQPSCLKSINGGAVWTSTLSSFHNSRVIRSLYPAIMTRWLSCTPSNHPRRQMLTSEVDPREDETTASILTRYFNHWTHIFQVSPVSGEWMNEWMNEWINEWMNEWINEWMNEWMNEGMKEWRNEGMKEWRNEGMKEWRNEGMNEIFYSACIQLEAVHSAEHRE